MSQILLAAYGALAAVSPDSIADLMAWYKADALMGYSDGDTVTSWPDESGNSNDLAAGGGNCLYKTAILNGLPIVRFPTITGGFNRTMTVSNPYTILIVYSSRTSDFATRRAIQGSNDYLLGPYQSVQQIYNGGFIVGGSISAGVFVKMILLADGGGGELRYNGASVGTNGATVTPGTKFIVSWFSGCGSAAGTDNQVLDGDIAEICVYSRKLTTPECVGLEAYLSAKWGV